MSKKKFFLIFIAFILCFNLTFSRSREAHAMVVAPVVAGAAAVAVMEFVVFNLVAQNVIPSNSPIGDAASVVKGFLDWFPEHLPSQYQSVINFFSHPIYWDVVNGKMRLTSDSDVYKVLISALGAYVDTVAVESDGVYTASYSGSADCDVITTNSNNYGVILNNLYNEYRNFGRGTGWANWYFDNTNVVTVCVGYNNNNSFFYVVYGDFPDCISVTYSSGVQTSCSGVYIADTNNKHDSNWVYTPYDILAKIYYDPTASGISYGSSSDNDVTLNPDFVGNSDTVGDDFVSDKAATYTTYNPDGTISHNKGIAVDVPVSVSGGNVLYDDDGFPILDVGIGTRGLLVDGDGIPIYPSDVIAGTMDNPFVQDRPETTVLTGAASGTASGEGGEDTPADTPVGSLPFGNFFVDLWNLFLRLIEELGKCFKAILTAVFIPPANEIREVFLNLKNKFETTFGIQVVDLSTLFGQAYEPQDFYLDFTLSGVPFHVKVCDMSILVAAVNRFRSLIRGLLTLALILFNINQFLHLIGAGPITLGGRSRGFSPASGEVVQPLEQKGYYLEG